MITVVFSLEIEIVAFVEFTSGRSVRLNSAVYSPSSKSTIHPSPLKPKTVLTNAPSLYILIVVLKPSYNIPFAVKLNFNFSPDI